MKIKQLLTIIGENDPFCGIVKNVLNLTTLLTVIKPVTHSCHRRIIPLLRDIWHVDAT